MEEEVICEKCGRRIEGEMRVSEELGEIIISHPICPANTFYIEKSIITGEMCYA